jgi:hypothetical protein
LGCSDGDKEGVALFSAGREEIYLALALALCLGIYFEGWEWIRWRYGRYAYFLIMGKRCRHFSSFFISLVRYNVSNEVSALAIKSSFISDLRREIIARCIPVCMDDCVWQDRTGPGQCVTGSWRDSLCVDSRCSIHVRVLGLLAYVVLRFI